MPRGLDGVTEVGGLVWIGDEPPEGEDADDAREMLAEKPDINEF